uniref:IMD domain-containing protein n=1 Tax=Rhabditophanes sp. KR3021 TaxID=114890 RepID=A0AC35TR38_9BILA
MTLEAETAILSSLFQAVHQDSKTTSNAFESACGKAKKLVSSLSSTAGLLDSFLDSIQEISDLANNLNGASRDIGADLTRFCLRQRSLQGHLREIATCLGEHFVGSLDKQSSTFRQRTSDIDRKYGKCFKKSKNRHKKELDQFVLLEKKTACTEMLMEQRNQFMLFVNALMPAMTNQVDLMEEGNSFREIRDSLQRTVTTSNSQEVVAVVLDDLVHKSDAAWQSRISSTLRKSQQNINDISLMNNTTTSRSHSPTASIATWNTESSGGGNSKYQSLNSVRNLHQSHPGSLSHRPSLSSTTFTNTGKPPLPVGGRQSMSSSFYESPPNSFGGTFHSFSISANELSDKLGRVQRPSSFFGDSGSIISGDDGSTSRCTSNFLETISQIDQITNGLNDFVETTLTRPTQNPGNNVRYRDSWKPPPPQRRDSTITSATRNAPSIAEVRLNCQSRASSIQDLTTTSSTTSGLSPQQTPTGPEYEELPKYQPPLSYSFRI